jgi:hypothetical protein
MPPIRRLFSVIGRTAGTRRLRENVSCRGLAGALLLAQKISLRPVNATAQRRCRLSLACKTPPRRRGQRVNYNVRVRTCSWLSRELGIKFFLQSKVDGWYSLRICQKNKLGAKRRSTEDSSTPALTRAAECLLASAIIYRTDTAHEREISRHLDSY